MNSTQKKFWAPDSLFHDFFLCFAFFCFITGLIPFAPESFYRLAGEKPWMHRFLIAAITFSAAIWAIARYYRAHRTENTQTPLVCLIKQIKAPMIVWVWAAFTFTSLLWSYASIARHQAFQSGFDMAIFTQAIWNTTQGAFLYSSIKGGICLLGDHFSPLLVVFSLPYYFWPQPECLLILQAVFCASGIFPLFLITKKKLGEKVGMLTVLFAFICYLPLRNSVRFEFHPEVAALPFFFWAYYFWERTRFFLCSLFLILALSSKESVAIVTFTFGFYALCRRRILFGVIWMVFSPLYFWLVVKFWIPQLSGQDYFYLSGNYLSWGHAGILNFLKHLLSLQSIFYLIKIFFPVGFLPLGDFAFFLTLPGLAQNLVSQNEMTRSIFFQYTAILTPFVFIALLQTLVKISPRRPALWIYLILCTLLSTGVSDFYIALRCVKERTPHFREISAYFAKVPPEFSVRTHEVFAAHLANRKEIHIYENNHPREGGTRKALNADYWVLDAQFLPPGASESIWGKDYDRVFMKDGFMILKRKPNV